MATARLFEPTADAERAFLQQRYNHFGRCAWQGFQQFGRGVVLVSVEPPDAPEKNGTIEYVSDSAAPRVWPGGWPEAAAARAVGEYDPATGFLVLVLDYEARTCRLHRFEGEEMLRDLPN